MNERMPFKNSNHSNYELILIPVTVIHNHIFFHSMYDCDSDKIYKMQPSMCVYGEKITAFKNKENILKTKKIRNAKIKIML